MPVKNGYESSKEIIAYLKQNLKPNENIDQFTTICAHTANFDKEILNDLKQKNIIKHSLTKPIMHE